MMYRNLLGQARGAALILGLGLWTLLAGPALANTVSGENGAVTSRSALASDAGLEMLEQGGNAVDAAVATGFALAVTYPSAGNIGGGGFMVVRLPDGSVLTQDAREKAPLAADRDMFLDENGDVDRQRALFSPLASGVPGSVAGLLDALDRYGELSRQAVMAPAIRLAEEGFELPADLAADFEELLEEAGDYPATIAKFSNDGEPLQAGDTWRQPDLAQTLRRISEQGRAGFYQGPTADMLVAEMERLDGLITHQDLAEYEAVWREPVNSDYRGYDIWSMGPPSSGGVLVAQMLNMLETRDLAASGRGSAQTVHWMVEAQRRAYADRAQYLGDPDFYPVPLDRLISEEYAQQRFADVEPRQASDSDNIGAGDWPAESMETTHYSVMDDEGMAVSLTTTLNFGYGNRIVVPGAGFLLNNEMDDFSAKPGAPNAYGLIGGEANRIEPGKRMLSSMSPTIVTRDDQPILVTGSPGGSTIINTVLQVVINVLDHDMPVEQAVASPRFHHQWKPDRITYEEDAFSDSVLQTLKDWGHRGLEPASFGIGDANSIRRLDDGRIEATSDPRSDGGASAF